MCILTHRSQFHFPRPTRVACVNVSHRKLVIILRCLQGECKCNVVTHITCYVIVSVIWLDWVRLALTYTLELKFQHREVVELSLKKIQFQLFTFCTCVYPPGMSSVAATVEINSSSKESIFAGNLLKAPPLNRRGRKVCVCSQHALVGGQ